MMPRSVDWSQVYEWDNYRLACSLMNSRKKDAIYVLDPFQVKTGWFELELVGFQIKPGRFAAGPAFGNRVERTITRLRLNEDDCRTARERYAVNYWNGELPLAFLSRASPVHRHGTDDVRGDYCEGDA